MRCGILHVEYLSGIFAVGGDTMKLRDYINSLTPEQLDAYAIRCSTTANYLGTHIRYATKEPSVKLIRALSRESNGAVRMNEVLEHYRLTDEARAGAAAA